MPRIVFLLLTILFAGAAEAATLRERLTPDVLAVVMPGAERLGAEEGSPPAIAVYKGNEIVAYLFSTLDVVRASGYSSVPFDVIAGVDLPGRITGAKAIFHAEPFVVNDPIRQPQLDTFLKREAGTSIRGGVVPALTPDFVAGATVTARAMRGAVADAARLVLRARVPVPQVSEPTLNREQYRRVTWGDLLAEGAVARRRITRGRGRGGARHDAGGRARQRLHRPLRGAAHARRARRQPDRAQPLQRIHAALSGGRAGDRGRVVRSVRFSRRRLRARRERLSLRPHPRDAGRAAATISSTAISCGSIPARMKDFSSQQYAALFALPPTFDPLKDWRLELLVRARTERRSRFRCSTGCRRTMC